LADFALSCVKFSCNYEKAFLLALALCLILIFMGCNKSAGDAETTDQFFDFKLSFGVNALNCVDTFQSKLTKDVVLDGTKTIGFCDP